jgi:hypothetical protein
MNEHEAAERLRKYFREYDYEYRCTQLGSDQAILSDAYLRLMDETPGSHVREH